MIITDKRKNANVSPVENVSNGNCFLHNNVLYLKTNIPKLTEPQDVLSGLCVRLDTGKLKILNKQIKVTPVDVECNIITKDENPTIEKTTSEKTTSKYILMAWTIFDDEVHVRQFDTKSEAQKAMETNYNAVLSAKKDNEIEIQHEFIGGTYAKIKTDSDIYMWQIKEIKF